MHRLGPQPAIVEHRGIRRLQTSYAQVAHGAYTFAADLLARGIAPGDRVLLWGENSAAWTACFFGCVMRGVLVVPLDAAGTPAFAERIVRETQPRLIVGDRLLLESITNPPNTTKIDLLTLDQAMRQPVTPTQTAPLYEGLSPEAPLQILFTSGTTGEPKGIVHTHRNLLASLTPIEREIDKYRRYERPFHPLRFLHTLPLSHVFGQFMGLWVAPVLGAVVHYESRLEATRLLRLLPRERISVLAAVPRVLSLLRAELLATYPTLQQELVLAQQERIWTRWWRFHRIHHSLGYKFWAIVCGGATLAPELESFWTTLGVALIQGYGMTETSALVTLNHPFKPARGTLGAPLHGRELRLGANGELEVRGEMVARATWQNGVMQTNSPDSPDDAQAGWLSTGDLATQDEEGRLRYLGRTGQRLVTSSGLNVYFEDIEAALASQPGIDAAVVVAIEGPQGPEPAAVLRTTDSSIAAAAVDRANTQLAAYQRVARWWIWPDLDLPRTTTGKVRRHLVEAWARQQLHRETAPLAAVQVENQHDIQGDPLLRMLAEVTGTPAKPSTHPETTTLEALGLDSLGRVQLQSALERATGRTIDDAAMLSARTLGDVRRLTGLGMRTTSSPHDQNQFLAHQNAAQENQAADIRVAVYAPLKAGLTSQTFETQSDPSRLGPSSQTPAAALAPAPRNKPAFLYLRWPWSAPVQWLRTLFLEACVRPIVWLLAKPTVHFEQQPATAEAALKQATPLIIVANHVTAYDVPLLLYALPFKLRTRLAIAAGGEMMENWRHARSHPLGPVIFWLLTILFNAFPLPQGRDFRRAFEHAGEALDRDYSVLIFPEGRRSYGGPVEAFRGGIGLLTRDAAVNATISVLPIALHEVRTPRGAGLRPYTTSVTVGPLEIVRAGEDPRAVIERLENAVRRLLNPQP